MRACCVPWARTKQSAPALPLAGASWGLHYTRSQLGTAHARQNIWPRPPRWPLFFTQHCRGRCWAHLAGWLAGSWLVVRRSQRGSLPGL